MVLVWYKTWVQFHFPFSPIFTKHLRQHPSWSLSFITCDTKWRYLPLRSSFLGLEYNPSSKICSIFSPYIWKFTSVWWQLSFLLVMFSVLDTISYMFVKIAFQRISVGLGENNHIVYRFCIYFLERQIILERQLFVFNLPTFYGFFFPTLASEKIQRAMLPFPPPPFPTFLVFHG